VPDSRPCLTHLGRRAALCAAGCAVALFYPALAQEKPALSPNPAVVAVDRLSEGWWADRHKAIIETVRARPDAQLLLIGDSVINNYDKANPPDENFQPVWKEFYEPRRALNLGFSGDTASHVLWRLRHGEVDGLHPKVALVLIGADNTARSGHNEEQTEAGIDAVVDELERRLPETSILLLGILPSDVSPAKTQRDRVINGYLATCYGEHPRVTYLDIGSIFRQQDVLRAALFYDPRLRQPSPPLHPDTNGQRMMAEAIEPTLAKLMGDSPRVPLASMTDINSAVIPVSALEIDSYDWFARHHAELALQKTLRPRVVLIGDSITHFWGGRPAAHITNGLSAWERVFGNMPVLNMGFGWDRTQNVLWRLRQGEFEGLSPKWIVVLIGTNNLTGTRNARANTSPEIVEGIAAICGELRQRSPASRIVLMGILPRGAKPDDRFRAPIVETNRLLAQRFAKDPGVVFLDLAAKFLTADGSLPASLFPDRLHPSDAGYQIWADALIQAGIKP
jgi:lysophospholipase L1-like esterase